MSSNNKEPSISLTAIDHHQTDDLIQLLKEIRDQGRKEPDDPGEQQVKYFEEFIRGHYRDLYPRS
jgi:hypothetical protein